MRVQQIQPNTTFNANKTTRRLDYESHELLEKLLETMDKETEFKSNKYAYESTKTRRITLHDSKKREIAELIDTRQNLAQINTGNQMFDNTCLTIGKVELVIENKTGKIIDYYKPFLKTWNSIMKKIGETLLDFNNGFYTNMVQKHRYTTKGLYPKGKELAKKLKV